MSVAGRDRVPAKVISSLRNPDFFRDACRLFRHHVPSTAQTLAVVPDAQLGGPFPTPLCYGLTTSLVRRIIALTSATEMPPEDTSIRVVVVADDHLARAGLAALLSDQPGCTVAGQTDPAQYASAEPELYRADVAVWDLGWQPERYLEYLSDAAGSGAPNVVLVSDGSVAAEASAAGARGVLHREVDPDTLMAALLAVNRGLAVLDPQLTDTAPPSQGDVDRPAPRRADGPGTRRAAPDSRGARQQGYCPEAGHQRAHRQVPRQLDPRQAGRPEPHRSRHPGNPGGSHHPLT